MNLWIDYTNHSGKRDWRPVMNVGEPALITYPPYEAHYVGPRRRTMCVGVQMIDRGNAFRVLALTSIHGYAYCEGKPVAQARIPDHDPMPEKRPLDALKAMTPNSPIEIAHSRVVTAAHAILDQAEHQSLDKIEWAMTHLEPMPDNTSLAYDLDMSGKRERAITAQLAETAKERDELKAQAGRLAAELDDLKAEFELARNAEKSITQRFAEVAAERDHWMKQNAGAAPIVGLDLVHLAVANADRQKEWAGDVEITSVYRANELAGEVGEACNIVKKLERERLGIKGSRATRDQLGRELGDVVICCDLVAMHFGLHLCDYVREAFNRKSMQLGFKTRIK